MTVHLPRCPRCGTRPATLMMVTLDNQSFCMNPDCVVISWNPTSTQEEFEASVKVLNLDAFDEES
jgi:hypothetical protein